MSFISPLLLFLQNEWFNRFGWKIPISLVSPKWTHPYNDHSWSSFSTGSRTGPLPLFNLTPGRFITCQNFRIVVIPLTIDLIKWLTLRMDIKFKKFQKQEFKSSRLNTLFCFSLLGAKDGESRILDSVCLICMSVLLWVYFSDSYCSYFYIIVKLYMIILWILYINQNFSFYNL